MKAIYSLLTIYIILLTLGGCKEAQTVRTDENPVARVGKEFLYPSDMTGIGANMSDNDSIYQAKIFIEQWIRDKLMLQVAESNIENSDEIERMVTEYRATLLMNAYEKALINQRMSSEVSPQELADYYANNKEQYQSGISWVRCHFVKAPRDLEGIQDLRKWFKSDNGVDFERVKLFCAKNKTIHILNEDLWIKYDKIENEVPEGSISSRHRSGGSILDRTDDNYIYLLQIFEYRDKEDATPLAQVQDEVKRIILHQRRNKILQDIRREVYEKAKKEGGFELF